MRKHLAINSVILLFFVSMLTNTLGWAFNDKVIAHELEHHYNAALFTADPQTHLEFHRLLGDEGELDAATHLCLHAAGQFLPFFLNSDLLIIPPVTEAKNPIMLVSASMPESIPDSLFHPPRNIS
ncbi:MAG TPA: hypothetical protein DEO56_11950 [Nitrosomonas nitrosa]|jgi:hypothetical protein|uniref:Uncharacterized protein n=1 Tax=Nitrosomonas nitrosa TaxID=52442 RepID=A0A1I4Q9H4_9PROT|nr:hypothetical protein [Nitrosomonas nitrosa]MCO6433936.1 hypothetical protein [Nitrosomonas nitrosa]PTQ95450.1 hypothetical protein C8R30_11440 [Nitrosomonas nitrosa]CAE6501020.1 conserved hypothetical protein [Nitrosomonas nitrosa]SFM36707.1 hypothetical protein SAMN05421880_11433 [Nitrosomonas nitrosa]HBZ31283.1 hypothetical protein [Nitrosomonas nitrosa]